MQDIELPEVSFDVLSKIYCGNSDDQRVDQAFQELHITGALKLMVSTSLKPNPSSFYTYGAATWASRPLCIMPNRLYRAEI
jgi:hypothetical protein